MNTTQMLRQSGGIVRGGLRLAEWLPRQAARQFYGLVQKARHLRQSPKPAMDDLTLANKVESEIFRGTRVPKASVNVNVVDGVVWLRGELKRPQQIRALEERAQAVPEVRGVENLLHLAKTPAPTRADTPRRQQRTRSSTRRPTPRRTGGRVSDDRSDDLAPQAEPTPAEQAERQGGRTPAPLGATRGEAGASDESTAAVQATPDGETAADGGAAQTTEDTAQTTADSGELAADQAPPEPAVAHQPDEQG